MQSRAHSIEMRPALAYPRLFARACFLRSGWPFFDHARRPMTLLRVPIWRCSAEFTWIDSQFLVRLLESASPCLPYQLVNGVFGGLLPVIGETLCTSARDIYVGLAYPVAGRGFACRWQYFLERNLRHDDLVSDRGSTAEPRSGCRCAASRDAWISNPGFSASFVCAFPSLPRLPLPR